jgi:hypothetical protein
VTCQAVVQVREKSTRAYVVKRQILEWKSSYNPATNKLANGLDNDNLLRQREKSPGHPGAVSQMRAMFLAYFCCRTSLYRYVKDMWCLALRKSMAANIYLRNGTLLKHLLACFT